MNTPQFENPETNLQERPVETLSDNSLPAAQVIEEQKDEAEQNNAPRFVPQFFWRRETHDRPDPLSIERI